MSKISKHENVILGVLLGISITVIVLSIIGFVIYSQQKSENNNYDNSQVESNEDSKYIVADSNSKYLTKEDLEKY